MAESLIENGVLLANGSYANTVGPAESVLLMYPRLGQEEPAIYRSEVVQTDTGLALEFVNSTLRFENVPEDRIAILGNTVTRLCPVSSDCGSCVLAGQELSIAEMSRINCARGNTAAVFEAVMQPTEGRFMLLPVDDPATKTTRTFVMGSGEGIKDEVNGGVLMQRRLPNAHSVVFTKRWAEQNGLEQVTVGMNGADGSFGVATMRIADDVIAIAFCSLRENMGDRGEDKQIIRMGINAYFDTQNYTAEQREAIIKELEIEITIGASATLKNFAHKIQVPADGTAYNDQLRAKYPDLVARAKGKVTSAIVLNDLYPGAFGRAAIFPQFEAENGIHETPITPDNCPGDGQTCHIDYRSETQYSLVKQLEDMGIRSSSIHYREDIALDPSDEGNNMASNRREQNNGVAVSKTNRTINAAVIRF